MTIQDVLGQPVNYVDISQLQIGDVVAQHSPDHTISQGIAFFAGVPTHTMLYVGGNEIIEADEGRVIKTIFNKYNGSRGNELWPFRPDSEIIDIHKFVVLS